MIFLINIIALYFIFTSKVNAQTVTPSIIPSSAPSPAQTPSPTPTILTNPSSGIFLSEFLPNPEDGVEWVEIINTNNLDVQISGWKINDSTSVMKSIPNVKISAGGYYVFELGQNYLNNGIDSVRLINNLGVVVDSYNYTQISTDGLTWTKSNGNWCFALVSKGQSNNPCFIPTSIPTSTPRPPTDTPVPSSTPVPTNTPTRIPTPTKTPSPTPTPSNTDSYPTFYPTSDEPPGLVLGTETTDIPHPVEDDKQYNFADILPGILIALGGLMLLTPLILAKIKHEKQVLE